jgi:hypothetical protein
MLANAKRIKALFIDTHIVDVYNRIFFGYNDLGFSESKLRWRTPLQATGYVRATAPKSVKGNNNPKQFSLSRS